MTGAIQPLLGDLDKRMRAAIAQFWATREEQMARQRRGGRSDAGSRGAVTGGAQMDGFIQLLVDLLARAGVGRNCVFRDRALSYLPGYYRPTKQWDIVVVSGGNLVVAVEAKSQVGSFGNNFNNRAEEAIGSSVDLWTAYREGAFAGTVRPWLGYLFVLEQCPASLRPVRVDEPHYEVFPEFAQASYGRRYEILCRKLVRERNYDAAAFLLSEQAGHSYSEPAEDLRMEIFVRGMLGHVLACIGAT